MKLSASFLAETALFFLLAVGCFVAAVAIAWHIASRRKVSAAGSGSTVCFRTVCPGYLAATGDIVLLRKPHADTMWVGMVVATSGQVPSPRFERCDWGSGPVPQNMLAIHLDGDTSISLWPTEAVKAVSVVCQQELIHPFQN